MPQDPSPEQPAPDFETEPTNPGPVVPLAPDVCGIDRACTQPDGHPAPCTPIEFVPYTTVAEPPKLETKGMTRVQDPPGWGLLDCSLCKTVHGRYRSDCPAQRKT